MNQLANTSFSPDTIAIMTKALNDAVATLPHPLSSSYVRTIAESILDAAARGERDPVKLQMVALLELKLQNN